ncbi:DUF2306 domain-containing protein [Actinoplanes sp. NPDC024001]|uniref:DUF2306 domain-containing protein n=1 Tax=Actinoplanes sp. NPDC024001 TaxID=3154598 RepID=UPI0033D0D193
MRSNRLVPVGLLALSAIPVLAGALRLTELAGGGPGLPDDRVLAAPVPLALHIVSATVFSALGAFQFVPGLRRRRRWHRLAGRVVLPAGLLAALSGLWLALFLPPGALDSHTLAVVRVVVAVAMTGSLVLGLAAIRRRDFPRHRAWMIRGYALGLGAGTQAFTNAAWLAAAGPLTTTGRTVTLTAGWLINIAVAEWIIRRPLRGSGAPARPGRAAPRRGSPVRS